MARAGAGGQVGVDRQAATLIQSRPIAATCRAGRGSPADGKARVPRRTARMKGITMGGLALLLGLAPAAARADQIRWGYDWAAFPGEVPAGHGKVVFSDEPLRTAQG